MGIVRNYKSIMILVILLLGCNQVFHPTGKRLPELSVSENKRFFVDEKGNPFFWLGDTGWLLFTKLNREEADQYLTDRTAKGFNVIQVDPENGNDWVMILETSN